jgi:Flp pilus assembly pilin Flp
VSGRTKRSRRPLLDDERGAVYAEYASVLIVASLIIAVATMALGTPLYNMYSFTESVMALPFP